MSRVLALVSALAACSAGCGSGASSVSGEVSYDGQPVKSGYVTFAPSDGRGPMAGGQIIDGRYTVADVPPGPKVVRVEASSGAAPSVQSSADAGKLPKELGAKLGPDGIIRTETVPPDAEGNNQAFEVAAGQQTLNLTLKKPPGKK